MRGLSLRCWIGGCVWAVKFRANRQGWPVPGYICTRCLRWKRSPFG